MAEAAGVLALALADIWLIVYLRRRRARKLAMERMTGSLELYVRGEVSPESVVSPPKRR